MDMILISAGTWLTIWHITVPFNWFPRVDSLFFPPRRMKPKSSQKWTWLRVVLWCVWQKYLSALLLDIANVCGIRFESLSSKERLSLISLETVTRQSLTRPIITVSHWRAGTILGTRETGVFHKHQKEILGAMTEVFICSAPKTRRVMSVWQHLAKLTTF